MKHTFFDMRQPLVFVPKNDIFVAILQYFFQVIIIWKKLC